MCGRKVCGSLRLLHESECDGVHRDTKSANGGTGESDMGPAVIVPPEIHPPFPFKRCDYTATLCAHTFPHALPAAVIQFRRLEGRDKEMEGAKRGAKG